MRNRARSRRGSRASSRPQPWARVCAPAETKSGQCYDDRYRIKAESQFPSRHMVGPGMASIVREEVEEQIRIDEAARKARRRASIDAALEA